MEAKKSGKNKKVKHPHVGGMDFTEAEGEAIGVLRLWTEAQEYPDMRQTLRSWEDLRFAAGMKSDDRAEYIAGYDDYNEAEKELLALAAAACENFIETRIKRMKHIDSLAKKQKRQR